MTQMKHAPKRKRSTKALTVLSVAGASLAATASGAAAGMLLPGTAPFILSEEEISDVSLATFHLSGPEKDITGQPLLHLTRCGGCGCGGGGCGHGGGCGGGGCGHAGGCGCGHGGGCALGGVRGCALGGGCVHGCAVRGCRGCRGGCGCGGCGCGWGGCGGWGIWGGCCLSWGGCQPWC